MSWNVLRFDETPLYSPFKFKGTYLLKVDERHAVIVEYKPSLYVDGNLKTIPREATCQIQSVSSDVIDILKSLL